MPATALPTVAPDWLALRATADDVARSHRLAAELGALMPGGSAVVHDLGAGDGAMVRWLAPRLPGPQTWVLHDADAGILARASFAGLAGGAGDPIEIRTRIAPLADLPVDAFAGAAAVTASALLDVITRDEAGRIVAACVAASVPAFFSLTVTGHVRLHPATRADAAIAAAFDAHQRRPAPGRDAAGPLLGPDAVPVVVGLFAAAGWHVRTDRTPWRLGAADRDLIAAWLDGWVDAAVEQQPALGATVAEFRARRVARLDAGALRVTVAHEDLLAWPR
ncbi:hypothetical protein LK09_18590 [Microbacterium mangrovi]|uniref:SAM-dependent methyltransferase n=1 Tax=Microbacterium mangrovi TaxID=1348253 RepID=A0A0B2A2A6_9MICO|nr:hypothetical protein LK09_18590 [Microbacterium mangrovi]